MPLNNIREIKNKPGRRYCKYLQGLDLSPKWANFGYHMFVSGDWMSTSTGGRERERDSVASHVPSLNKCPWIG